MRKSVSTIDLDWLSNRADTLLLAHLTQNFPIPTVVLAAGMSKKATTALQQHYPKADLSIADLTLATLPATNHSVDLFIANLLSEHEMDLIKLFSEVERVLGEEGILLFTTNDSRTKNILEKYAQAITDDLVDENITTEKLEKIDVVRFFFRRYHVLSIEQATKFIDCDVFIASAAFPPQLLKKLLEYPIRIDEVVLQETPVLTDNETQHAEKREHEQEQEEASEDEEEQELEEFEDKIEIEAAEPKEESVEKPGELEITETSEARESEEIKETEKSEGKESEPQEVEKSENEIPEAKEDKEIDVEEKIENKEDEIEPETEKAEFEKVELSEHEKIESSESEEPEESDEAEDEEVSDEEEPEELEESEERQIETKAEHPEPHEKEKLESSEYRELHILSGLLHENEKALQEHETVMNKELHNTVRVLSKSQLMHSNADAKQKQTKQLEQHKQLLNDYRSLTNKHKELVGDFMQNHARLLENYADPTKKFQQLINRQTNVIKRHVENIEQHEAFLNTKK